MSSERNALIPPPDAREVVELIKDAGRKLRDHRGICVMKHSANDW